MRLKNIFAAVMCIVFFTGCSNLRRLNKMDLNKGDFNTELARNYRDMANFEAKRHDIKDRLLFAAKAQASIDGNLVLPTNMSDRDLPHNMIPEMHDARVRLMRVMDNGSRKQYPVVSAKAQAVFDHWLEEVEENKEPQRIVDCRNGFYNCLQALEKAMVSPACLSDKTLCGSDVIYFEFGSTAITSESQKNINNIITLARKHNKLTIMGCADAPGSANINVNLSFKRAHKVKDILIKGGVPHKNISVGACARNALPVKTQKKEQENRRVEIFYR